LLWKLPHNEDTKLEIALNNE